MEDVVRYEDEGVQKKNKSSESGVHNTQVGTLKS